MPRAALLLHLLAAATMLASAIGAASSRLTAAAFFSTSRRAVSSTRAARRTLSTTAVRMGSTSTPAEYPSLHGKNLVSISDCLDAWGEAAGGGRDKVGGTSLTFVDGSWYHRGGRNGRAEFETGPRIPGAVHVDMDDIAAKGPLLNPKELPHMLPPKELFAAAMDSFGISNDHHVVVYGREGCVFTPRTFFLFRSMGHDPEKVHLMQGSFEEWAKQGGEVETGRTTVIKADDLDLDVPARYQAQDASNVVDMNHVLRIVEEVGSIQGDAAPILLDPRGTTFHKHHMPGAINIPYLSLVKEDDWLKFRPREELLRIFEDAGVDVSTERQIVCTCGSGVSVCHLFLALEECGRDNGVENTVIYDGSWAEWGKEENTPKVFGDSN